MNRAKDLKHLNLVKIVYKDGGHALVEKNHAWEYQNDVDYSHTENPTDEEIVRWINHFDAPPPEAA
jgi:hypothetical protein